MGHHPDGDKFRLGPDVKDNPAVLLEFLTKKYKEKTWYDAEAAARPMENSGSGRMRREDSLTDSPSAAGGRKRVGSGSGSMRGAAQLLGQDVHRAFLVSTHARAAAMQAIGMDGTSSTGKKGFEEDAEMDALESISDPEERAAKIRVKLKTKLVEFYQIHNPEKLNEVDTYLDWIQYNGLSAFNKKLRDRYKAEIPTTNKSRDLKLFGLKKSGSLDEFPGSLPGSRSASPLFTKVRKAISRKDSGSSMRLADLERAAQEIAEMNIARARTESTNPFDDVTSFDSDRNSNQSNLKSSELLVDTESTNPFDDLVSW